MRAARWILIAILCAGCGYDGLMFIDAGSEPPDTNLAVGTTHIVEVVNGKMRIAPRNGTASIDRWLSNVLSCGTESPRDPRVVYDRWSSRFFVSAHTNGHWCLAVSNSNDASGPFTPYTFLTPGQNPDFGGLAVHRDHVVLTANIFGTPSPGAPLGPSALILNKADIIGGGIVRSQRFTSSDLVPPGIVMPARATGANGPWPFSVLVAQRTACASCDNSGLTVWNVVGTPGVGAGVSLLRYDFTIPRHLFPQSALQLGSPNRLDAGDGRILDAVLSFSSGMLWITSNAGCSGIGSCLKIHTLEATGLFGQIWNYLNTETYQKPGKFLMYPALAANSVGDLVVVFNQSAADEYPSVYATGRRHNDPGYNLRTQSWLVKAGTSAYLDPAIPTGSTHRYGDYSGADVDPLSDNTFWLAAEYPNPDPDTFNLWRTWIVKIAEDQLPP